MLVFPPIHYTLHAYRGQSESVRVVYQPDVVRGPAVGKVVRETAGAGKSNDEVLAALAAALDGVLLRVERVTGDKVVAVDPYPGGAAAQALWLGEWPVTMLMEVAIAIEGCQYDRGLVGKS